MHLNPQNVDQIYVCTRAPTVFLMTLQGQVGWAGQLALYPQLCLEATQRNTLL